MEPKGIIFTGGPNSVYGEDSPLCRPEIFELGIPILGICYGSQLMAHMLGGRVETAPVSEYGKTEVDVEKDSVLFEDVSPRTVCWMSHTDYISAVPEGFRISFLFCVCGASPCQRVTEIPASSHSSSSRPNWSLMSAFKGAI